MSMIGTRTDLYNLKIPVDAIKAAIAGGGGGTVTAANITDATAAGRALLTSASATTQRTSLRAAQVTALTAVATPDGSDAATTQTLANALKVAVNAIITAIKA